VSGPPGIGPTGPQAASDLARDLDDPLRREPELLGQRRVRRRCAEAVHAVEPVPGADQRRRTERHRRLDDQPPRLLRKHALAIVRVLGQEAPEVRHRHDPDAPPVRLEQAGDLEQRRDLRAAADEHEIGRAARLGLEHVATARGVRLDSVRLEHRKALARQQQRGRPGVRLERSSPRGNRLARVGRPPNGQVRNRAERGEMLHGLMRRPVFADEDRVVREHERHRVLHHRGEPQRRAHVVAEDQERTDVRPDPAVERETVGDRPHGVLAHPVVDVASVELASLDERPTVETGRVRRGEVGGAPDQ
jgi:hypothetical protein